MQLISFVEYLDWQLFDNQSPIGDERLDVLLAYHALNTRMAKGSNDNLIPKWGQSKEEFIEDKQKAFKQFVKTKSKDGK